MSDETVLDNPIHAALAGPQASLAQVSGTARRYPAEVAPFIGLPNDAGEPEWADAASLLGPGELAATFRRAAPVPPHLTVLRSFEVAQMTVPEGTGVEDPEFVTLGGDDVPEMLELIGATNPGPFFKRTVEMGRYVGLRRDGTLVAMAGERMHPPGWTEVSAVCTAEHLRGQGIGARLVRTITAGIDGRGERAFLHAVPTNVNAMRLYEQLGFTVRVTMTVNVIAVPS